jgi:hypothetical protein
MKLFALISVAAANWNGVSEDNSCGMQISGDSMVNSTCTISGSSLGAVFAGNGAFITGANTFTGFDGISGNADVVVFFEQDCSSGTCDNSTCWDAAVSCVDNGAASAGVFFMESVNDNRMAKGYNVNLQIAGVSAGDTLSFQLNSDNGGWACQNITAPFGSVAATPAGDNWYSDNGAFTVTVGDGPFGDLFQVSVTQQPGETGNLNLWASSVSN